MPTGDGFGLIIRDGLWSTRVDPFTGLTDADIVVIREWLAA